MKIPANASYELIYSIAEHPYLGPLIEAYIVQLTSSGKLSLVHQRIHANNADFYDRKLDESDYQTLKLLDEITPEFIAKKFSTKGRIRPKDFFDREFRLDLHRKQIRPFIEKRLAQVLKLIYGKKVYRRTGKNVIAESADWSPNRATVLFHLRRNEDNTHYFATIKHNGARINITGSHSLMLTESPCYLLCGGLIMQFDDEPDGAKLAPFLKKKFIEIPRKSEREYLQKFVIPLLEEHSVYAVGYEISSEKFKARPKLKITHLVDGQVGALLLFQYGEHDFPFQAGKEVSVFMTPDRGSYQFTRVRRSLEWEGHKSEALKSLELQSAGGAEFKWGDQFEVHDAIGWLKQNQESLQKAGFEVEIDLDHHYSLMDGELTYTIRTENDWFDVRAMVRFGTAEIPFITVRKAILSGDRFITLPNDQRALIPQKWIDQIKGLDAFSTSTDAFKLDRHHIGLIQELELDSTKTFKTEEALIPLVDVETPSGFQGSLRPYQHAGYNWLNFLYANHFGGCLADDMGLGKTVQTLAFLQQIKEHGLNDDQSTAKGQMPLFGAPASRTSLLVVPTSLTHNWYYESKRFTPDLNIGIHAGPGRAKTSDRFSYYDLIITTYGTLRNDLKIFKSFDFELIILDESQFIKNPTSKMARSAYQLNGRMKLVLTGTPVENSITDLWSQMNMVNPGILGGFTSFKSTYVTPIEKHHQTDLLERLQKVIQPFVMRRTKMQVATDLPPKTEQIVYCDMTEEQEDIYEKTKSTYRNQILDAIQSNGMAKSQIQILAGLTKLRQMANHPLLCEENFKGESGKFDEVVNRLHTALDEGHKVLMFSQFVGHLTLYRHYLDERGIDYAYLDGGTAASVRKDEVRKFQQEEVSLFLISLKAGGFGLNLTAADYVFLLDPWWNPAAENQAVDRAHRIGQDKPVFSYKFVTGNTVEDKIIRLQEKKLQLSSSLIKTEESFIKKINMDELQEILT
ncbi:MAG: DEAD/DEAH box helicase [Bacteroidetes bacterium]|nr:DEAD/DEAH box helicase [Bacteroidota bacterium]